MVICEKIGAKKYNNKQKRVKTVSKRKKRKKRNKKGSKLLKGIKKTKRKTRKVIKIKGGKYTEDDKRKVCTDLYTQLENSNNYKQLNEFLEKELS